MAINIFFAIVGSAILLYCLWSRKTKKLAIFIASVFAVIVICGQRSSDDYDNPANFAPEYHRVLEARGMSLADAKTEMMSKTPYENGVVILLVISCLLTLGYLVCQEEGKRHIRQIKRKCVRFFVLFVIYLLSLYYGMTIPYTMVIPGRYILKIRRVFA